MDNEITQKISLQVFDAEEQKWKEVSQKEQVFASHIHNQVMTGVFYSAAALTKMLDERLYLALGCESRDEYINTMLPYSRRQAYTLLAIGRKFSGILGDTSEQKMIGDGSVHSSALEEGESTEKVHASALNGLGIKKLYELTKFDDVEIDELMKTGSTIVNGDQITLEELKESSAKEVTKRIAEVKKLYSGKISQLQEEVKQLKEEKKIYEKVSEEVQTKIVNAIVLEKQYGGIASKLEDKQERIQDAYKLLNDFVETLVRCGVNDNDPLVLQQQLVDLIRQVDGVYNRIQLEYENVIVNIG